MEEHVRQHCAVEEKRSHKEASSLYRQRLNDEISRAIISPYCIPSAGIRKHEREWINGDRISLEQGFSFYHHSPDALLEFAVQYRGDADLHISDMDNLYLDEFPGIVASQPIYMVSTNGQHRRLVYACIGLPAIRACIQKAPTNQWKYYWSHQNHEAEKILIWFHYLGLIDDMSCQDRETIVFEGKGNLAGWLLPDARLGSVGAMLKEVQKRAEALNRRFGLDPELFNLLCSKTRRRLSLEWAYTCNRLCISRQNTSSLRPS